MNCNENCNDICYIKKLPKDVLKIIFDNLWKPRQTLRGFVILRLICKTWRATLDGNDNLWRRVAFYVFGDDYDDQPKTFLYKFCTEWKTRIRAITIAISDHVNYLEMWKNRLKAARTLLLRIKIPRIYMCAKMDECIAEENIKIVKIKLGDLRKVKIRLQSKIRREKRKREEEKNPSLREERLRKAREKRARKK